jgi:HAD superfamily hydrolase (TIGR01549 family)
VLSEFGISMTRAWFRERYSPDWRRGYRELGVPEHLWAQTSTRWAEEMVKMRPRAMPWARRAIRRLRRHGIRLGLVTASTRDVVEPNLERLNLGGVFEVAWYADDVAHGKPHPEALLRALAQLHLDATDAVYVGDTTVDVEMARAAGVPFAAVAGTTSEAAFRAAGVERVWGGVSGWVDDLLGPADRDPSGVARRRMAHRDPTGRR